MSTTKSNKTQDINVSGIDNTYLIDKLNHTIENGIGKLIGSTPLIDLTHLIKDNTNVQLYAKAEFLNPGGSVKDRAALNIIKHGIISGELTPDKILIDSTSGNTGIAYAMICAVLGIKLQICIPKNASNERMQLLKAYGADLILTDPLEGSDGALEVANELVLANPDTYFYANQYNNPNNWKAHYDTTGIEIWEQTNKKVTHFVAGLGTTGSFGGISKRLKKFNTNIQTISFQPDSPFHGMEGLKHIETAVTPGIYMPHLVDYNMSVTTEEAYKMTKKLATSEGLLIGISSGASIVAALNVAKIIESGVIVTILADRGDRYLSENIWRNEDD